MEKCGRQKVSVKLFLCSETQAEIIGRHGLASKIFAIDVIRNQTSAEIIFDHFDRSTLPPFDAQRISKSSSNFFADIPSLA